MGQVQANLNESKANRNDVVQTPAETDNNTGGQNASLNGFDGMKANNLNSVRNRIDMLIEDCLNIKETSLEKKLQNVNVVVAQKDENKIQDTSENNSENKPENIKNSDMGSVGVSRSLERKTETDGGNENLEKETSQGSENSRTNMPEDKANHSVNKDNKPEQPVVKSSSESVVKYQASDSVNDSLERLREEQLNLTKRKTITTFQKFIDEVFDSSLHDVDTSDVKIPKNFLKLCTDSLVVKDPPKKVQGQVTSVPSEIARKKEDIQNEKTRIINNKKVTLKDHIERFLEVSFEEEMADTGKDSVATNAKNLNAHMLVNDMISRGLGAAAASSQALKNDPKKAQNIMSNSHTMNYSQHNSEIAKRQNLVNGNQNVVIIDGDSDREDSQRPYFHDKQRQTKYPTNSSNHSPNAMYMKGQSSYHSQTRNHPSSVDNARMYNERHDPFDPRFADPKFQDNRIDIVPHEVNANSKRDLQQFDRRHIPKMSPNSAGPLPMPSKGIYHQKVHIPQSSAPMPMHHSPSMGRSEYHGMMARGTHVVTGHHIGCKCPGCLSPSSQINQREHQQQSMSYFKHHMGPSESQSSRISPISNQKAYYNEQAMMMGRPQQAGVLQVSQSGYPQLSPKLVPQRSPISAPPVESQYRRSPSSAESMNARYMNVRQTGGYQEHYTQGHAMSARRNPNEPRHVSPSPEMYSRVQNEEFLQAKEGPAFRSKMLVKETVKRRADYDGKMVGGQDRVETESAPLDLTVKRSGNEHGLSSGSSQQFGQPSHNTTKLSPTLTFIKHLENSVDKYCQELNSPPSPVPGVRQGRQVDNRSISPGGKVGHQIGQYSPLPNPHGASPQGLYPPMLQGRSLPSPHYSGGITMGQPLVDKAHKPYQQAAMDGYTMANNEQNMASLQTQVQQGPSPAMMHSQGAPVPPGQINFDASGKRITSNVSRHEPVPNLIGNHDSNDILYLYCKVCNSTYGSLYGFRKHFRNQHGFEPRAEHTVVHTISGTKSALHIPAAMPIDTDRHSQTGRQMNPGMWSSRVDERRGSNSSDRSSYNFAESQPGQISPQGNFSPARVNQPKGDVANKQGNLNELEIKEEKATKFLECPECGKTFQLNDFGSYKRHCRQHGHIKPFGCTDCQLSFNDQRGLKEHYKIHMKESQIVEENKGDTLRSVESSSGRYSTDKCDRPSLNSNSAQLDTHRESVTNEKVGLKREADISVSDHIKQRDQSVAQTRGNIQDEMRSDMSQKICLTQSIVKQAAESMTAQACPDSSWDKPENKTDIMPRPNSEVSVENCDSGYSSSVGSNMSQLVSDDNSSMSSKKCDEKDNENTVYMKADFHRSESSEDNYDFYKHKKFFKRKHTSSFSSSPGDCSSSKCAKVETPPLSGSNLPVSTSTVLTTLEPCDSAEESKKSMDVTQEDINDEKLNKLEIKVSESGEVMNKIKSEARHNLPFVWDRATRSRKTK